MKRILQILLVALMVCSCGKELTINEDTFYIELKRIQSDGVWVDISPCANDFYYFMGAITKEEFNGYADKAEFVRAMYDALREDFRYFQELVPELEDKDFNEIMMYQGSYLDKVVGLSAGTDYVFYAIKMTTKGELVPDAMTIPFRTTEKVVSDITFSLDVKDGIAYVTPSCRDKYYWDYELVNTVGVQYLSPEIFFEYTIYMLIEYDMIDLQLSQGEDSEDMKKFYDLKGGEEFYFVAAAYDSERNSDHTIWRVKMDDTGMNSEEIEQLTPETSVPGAMNSSRLKRLVSYSPKR